jgi:2-hydroxychromene-2-carboxylate isomerase
MKRIDFYLDFISPYAYLAFERCRARWRAWPTRCLPPVLFAGLLKHHGQLGPAEIPAKRDWTYRQVLWLAHRQGVAAADAGRAPVQPAGLLRLAWACARQGAPNRYVCETIFRHVWQGGAPADDVRAPEALTAQLAPARDPASDAVKHDLRAATDAALAAGVFGVPTFAVDGRLFWGFDALPLLRAQLEGDTRVDEALGRRCKRGARRAALNTGAPAGAGVL